MDNKKNVTLVQITAHVQNLERLDNTLKKLAEEQKEAIEKFNNMLQTLSKTPKK